MKQALHVRLMLVWLTLGLVVAACGSDSDDEAADDVTATTTSEGAETEETSEGDEAQDFGGPLRVILSSQFNLPLIGADAADELGIFDDMGLEVELIESQDVVPGLASGDADIAIASPNRFVGGIKAGLEATIVGPTADVWDQFWIVRPDTEAESLADFPGGKVGISSFGSAGHYSAAALGEEIGLTEGEDYEFVTLSDLDGLMAGLANGTIDAFAWSAQAAFTLEREGTAKILGHVSEVLGPNPLDVIAVANSTIEERPEAVKAFCEAYYEGQKRFKEDEELATKTFVDVWEFDPEIAPLMVEAGAPFLSTTDEITDEMLDNMAEATVITIEDVGEVTGDDVAAMYTPCSEL